MNELAVHLSWHDDESGCFTSRSLLIGESQVVNGVRVTLGLSVADHVPYPHLVFDRAIAAGDEGPPWDRN